MTVLDLMLDLKHRMLTAAIRNQTHEARCPYIPAINACTCSARVQIRDLQAVTLLPPTIPDHLKPLIAHLDRKGLLSATPQEKET